MRRLLTALLALSVVLAPVAGLHAQMGGLRNKNIDKLPPAALMLGAGANPTDIGPMLLVRIEFPGAITPAGLESLIRHVRATEPLITDLSEDYVRSRLLDQINKSAYYALRFYRNLVAHGGLPPESVAVQAVVLDAPREPHEILATIRPPAMVPAVLTIRSSVYRAAAFDVTSPQARPGAEGGVKAFQNSFGDFVTSQISLVTEPAAWPGGMGVVAAYGSEAAAVLGRSCDPETCFAGGTDIGTSLQVFYGVGMPMAVSLAKVANGLPYPYPVVEEKNRVTTCPDTPAEVGSLCLHERLMIALTRQALHQVDPYLATRFQWKAYIKRLDPDLAVLWPGNAWGTAQRQRVSYIKELMKAERSYLAQTTAKAAELAVVGPLGVKLREQRASERAYGAAIAEASKPDLSLETILGVALSVVSYTQALKRGDVMAQQGAISQIQAIQVRNSTSMNETLNQLQSVFAGQTERSYSELFGARFEETIFGQRVQADSIDHLRREFVSLYRSQKLPPLPLQEAVCADMVPGTQFEWRANGSCQKEAGQPPKYKETGAVAREKDTRFFVGTNERKDGFNLVGLNRLMVKGITQNLGTVAAYYFNERTKLDQAAANIYEIDDPSGGSINFIEGVPSRGTEFSLNGSSRRATEDEQSRLLAAISTWRSQTKSLISYETAH